MNDLEADSDAEVRHAGTPPIVGIGSSAGGIEALSRLLPAISPATGLAFVVVQHLDPVRASNLAAALGRVARIPASLAADGVPISADHIYVIPPNTTLTIRDGALRLAEPDEARGRRNPIDAFLISLAEGPSDQIACIILSGTGSDGAMGLRAVKERGGLTLAQDGAEHDGMMRSAVATGSVDFVLPVEEMAAKLSAYFGHRSAPEPEPDDSEQLQEVITLLRRRTGHDFREYKAKTLVRRVQRRMKVLHVAAMADYLDRLKGEPREIDALFQDLLIGVTSFFRDAPLFDALERIVIPRLFDGKGPDDTVRVWVPGCSTGEEAYSIAILLREHMPRSRTAPRLQVFATDIDERALEVARTGRYPASISQDVPAARLDRHFLREDGTYRIAGDLREMCLFSPHNLLRDAPFSKLDLISCRNLLIYLGSDLQNRVIPLFHYALRDNGYLFLGSSENVTRHSRLFATIDKAARIFLKRPQAGRSLPEFPLTAPEVPRRGVPAAGQSGVDESGMRALVERQVLDRYAPAYVVVNSDGDVLQSSGRTGKYLELAAGAPDHNILSLARPGLRLDLRVALSAAVGRGQPTVKENVTVGTNGGSQTINLFVQPLRVGQSQEPVYVVVFQDIGGIKAAAELLPGDVLDDAGAVRQLEMELRATRERLQTTTEELESSNEELKSGNEELSSMNEELQSANEELETSKEELQSINEELQTVNAELSARVEELSRSSSDMANLLQSTQIATVFLDARFTVKSFTPAAKDLFHLVESDAGRPIGHVRQRFAFDALTADAERVLRTLGSVEHHVESDTGARYVMRILPYRTVENVISGVVITFTDVTRMSAAEARIGELAADLSREVASLQSVLDLLPVGILFIDTEPDARPRANRAAVHLAGERDGSPGLRPLTASWRLQRDGVEIPWRDQPLVRALLSGGSSTDDEVTLLRPDGSTVAVMMSAAPLRTEGGAIRGAIAAVVDVSAHKAAAARNQALVHELQHRVKNTLATVGAMAARVLKPRGGLGDVPMSVVAEGFLARLAAMSRMHDLLAAHTGKGADLRDLLLTVLEPYRRRLERAVRVDGPPVILDAKAAGVLGMVFHELATNAAKYGSLSAADGGVDVRWRVDAGKEGPELDLEWIERDGPRVSAPSHEGFGTSFIRRSVEYELRGSVGLDFTADGVRFTLRAPLQPATDGAP